MFGVKLSENQKKKILTAKKNGSDIAIKISKLGLTGDDFLELTKVQAKHLEKNKISGKGMVINLSSAQVKKFANNPNAVIKIKKGKKTGSGVPPQAVMAMVQGAQALLPIILPIVTPLLADLQYIISNPAAARFKGIYVDRIPNLGFIWEKLGNKVDFLNKKSKPPVTRINKLELGRANIVALITKLLMQLPRLKQVAEAKDEVLATRELKKWEDAVSKAQNNLESLMKDDPTEGDGLQIGNGMQIGPRGSGMKKKTGSGLQVI